LLALGCSFGCACVFLLKDGYHVAKIFTEEYRAELALPVACECCIDARENELSEYDGIAPGQ
jgi:hypothetical protein